MTILYIFLSSSALQGLISLTLILVYWNLPGFSCSFFVFLTDVFEKALNAGFIQATDYVEIWQAYLDYLRRRVDFSKGESSCVKQNFRLCLETIEITCYSLANGVSFFFFFSESSKELEELRGAFARSLDYMKQDVEESRWI